MSSTIHLPRHLYLIAGADTPAQHDADREHMGSKAFDSLRMARIGLPVPPALVVGTHHSKSPDGCMLPVFTVGIPALEEATGMVFGDARQPLVVSVRSGAAVSMPGMLESLLNVGLCDKTVPGLLRQTGNPRLVWDSYRRLISSYAEIVAGLSPSLFEEEIALVAQGRDQRLLDFRELRDLARRFLSVYQQHAGQAFPQNVNAQLSGAIRAVFASWNADKARAYRKRNQIEARSGTAVMIQRMVFGNTGAHSGAGVGFTRDPTTGAPGLWIDFLANAQGEDVVSGRRNAHGHQMFAVASPEAWRKLEALAPLLEQTFGDMQDFEFTVQDGVLHLLQTRPGKRTPLAAARIALDLLDEGVIDADTALQRTGNLRDQDVGTVRLAPPAGADAPVEPLARAVAAGPGVVSGEIALDGERAGARSKAGASTILIRQDAQTSDSAALEVAGGLLTGRGARTSHAAVVARQLAKVCLVGCEDLRIDLSARVVRLGNATLAEGEIVTLDGNEGLVYAGAVAALLVPDTALLERLHALRSPVGASTRSTRRE